MSITWVALDTETTGMSNEDDICEFAWAELDYDLNVVRQHGSLIKPPCTISPGAAGVHGITNAKVQDAPTMWEFFESHAHPFEAENIITIAHNAPFDMRYLGKYMEVSGSLCTLKLARRIYTESPDHKMQTLRHYLELDVEGTSHSAGGDVAVLVALLQRMKDDTNLDLFGLYELSCEPSVISKMPFGKHRGEQLKDLPPDYVQWLLKLDNLSEDLRYSLTQCS